MEKSKRYNNSEESTRKSVNRRSKSLLSSGSIKKHVFTIISFYFTFSNEVLR